MDPQGRKPPVCSARVAAAGIRVAVTLGNCVCQDGWEFCMDGMRTEERDGSAGGFRQSSGRDADPQPAPTAIPGSPLGNGKRLILIDYLWRRNEVSVAHLQISGRIVRQRSG